MGWFDFLRGSKWTPTPVAPSEADPAPAEPAYLFTVGVLMRVGATVELAQTYVTPLHEAALRFDIATEMRRSMFLAQVAHESGLFRYVRELWGPTAAQMRYEGRVDLGNTQPGDGSRFRGRGLIQITGRANVQHVGWAFGKSTLTETCEWLESPEGAAMSAAWFWNTHGCNALADAGDFVGVTRKINGGTNGLSERIALWSKARAAIAEIS